MSKKIVNKIKKLAHIVMGEKIITKIKKLTQQAYSVLSKGKVVVADSEEVWTYIQTAIQDSKGIYKDAANNYSAFKKTWGEGDIGVQIMASPEARQSIEAITGEANGIKDKVFEIYFKINGLKANAQQVVETLGVISAELEKWEKIKKETEGQLLEAKLEILKAVATCKKLATEKYQASKGELDELLVYLGTLDLAKIDSARKKEVVSRFKTVMKNYNWFSKSEGESEVKTLKKAIKSGVTNYLSRLLDTAIAYAKRAQSWQKLGELAGDMAELESTLYALDKKADREVKATDPLSRLIRKLADKLIVSAGSEASVLLGDLVKPSGPAFDLVGKFLKAYNLASGAIAAASNFPENLERELPKTFSREFANLDSNFLATAGEYLSISLSSVPIASLGWISLTAGTKIDFQVQINLSGTSTFYDVFKPEELRILDLTLVSASQLTAKGSLSIGLNLLGLVKAGASASLSATFVIKSKQKKSIYKKLSAEAKQGTFKLKGKQFTLEFVGKLAFNVKLDAVLRDIARFTIEKDPIATWVLGEFPLLSLEVYNKPGVELRFDAVSTDFSKFVAPLRDPSSYRFSAIGYKSIDQSLNNRLGKRKIWEKYAGGTKLSEEEINELRNLYAAIF